MKKIILTVIITLVMLVVVITAYIYSGNYNVSQMASHNRITKWMIRTTKHYSIKKRLKSIKIPPLNDTAMIVQGFLHYNEMCVICHGAPGVDPDEIVQGLYPKPPVFYKSNDMPDPDEAFWIIKNGIKLTSMPAFSSTHTERNIWEITDFLLNKMNKMSPSEYSVWVKKYSDQSVETKM